MTGHSASCAHGRHRVPWGDASFKWHRGLEQRAVSGQRAGRRRLRVEASVVWCGCEVFTWFVSCERAKQAQGVGFGSEGLAQALEGDAFHHASDELEVHAEVTVHGALCPPAIERVESIASLGAEMPPPGCLRVGVAAGAHQQNLSLADAIELRGAESGLDLEASFRGGQDFAALKGTLVELELLISGDAMAFSIGWRDEVADAQPLKSDDQGSSDGPIPRQNTVGDWDAVSTPGVEDFSDQYDSMQAYTRIPLLIHFPTRSSAHDCTAADLQCYAQTAAAESNAIHVESCVVMFSYGLDVQLHNFGSPGQHFGSLG